MTGFEMDSARGGLRFLMLTVCTALGLIISGCGPTRAKAVNVEMARKTLIKVLEQWQSGRTIDQLRNERPEIIAQEPLWSNGTKLVEFTLIDDGRAEDANWYCEVELSLSANGSEKPKKKKVTYVVGTDPVLTVFHAIL